MDGKMVDPENRKGEGIGLKNIIRQNLSTIDKAARPGVALFDEAGLSSATDAIFRIFEKHQKFGFRQNDVVFEIATYLMGIHSLPQQRSQVIAEQLYKVCSETLKSAKS